jgi:CAAX protease family protein
LVVDGNELRTFLITFMYPIVFGGLAAYFVCFWPGKTPVRRIALVVCLPTVVSLALILRKFFDLSQGGSSVFGPNTGLFIRWLRANAWNFSSGLYFCVFGLLLVLIYTARLAYGTATLPLCLWKDNSPDNSPANSGPDSLQRLSVLVFVLVGPLVLIGGLLGLLVFVLSQILSWRPSLLFAGAFATAAPVLDAVLLVGIALCILGGAGRSAARTALKLPEPRYALAALLLVVVICAVVPTGHFVIERMHWAAHDFGKYAPPELSSYIDLSSMWHLSIVMLIFGAFAEELVFRGMLLPQFIRRYGLHRGIFITGIAWAAIHFRSDSYSGLSVGGVLLHLSERVLICLALNYVFVWMTLRWKSIIPAAIAHSVSNMFVMAGVASGEDARWEVQIVLWALVAVMLYRFWPLKTNAEQGHVPVEPEPSPAI